MLLSLLMTLSALAEEEVECKDPKPIVNQAVREVESFFLADATQALQDAKEACACSAVVEPELLGRLWQAEGMIHMLQGDEDAALHSFAASRRVGGDTWNPNYGPQAKQLFLSAVEEGQGRLEIKGLKSGLSVAVDGASFEPPADLAMGLHMVQVMDLTGVGLHAGVVDIPLDDEVTLSLDTFDADLAANMAYLKHPHSSRGLLIAGLSAGVLSGTAFFLASRADDRFMETGDRDEAGKWSNINHASIISGGMLGAAAGGLALGAVIQGRW